MANMSQAPATEKKGVGDILGFKVFGMPLPLYAFALITLLLSHFYNALPTDLVGGFAIMFIIGAAFGEIGKRLPIFNKYIGGAPVMIFLVAAYFVYAGIFTQKEIDAITNVMDKSNFLNLFIARQCDWLHLFVVKEDASFFSYQDRVALIEQGIAGIDNVTLHPGSAYVISRATFPGYFLKDKGVVDDCYCQIDLQLFRERLAPALHITHRFVGNEPLCPLTRNYNKRMKQLLEAPGETPPITVVELERVEKEGGPISASRVRKLYKERQWSAIAPLVPAGTLSYLMHRAEREQQTA